MAVVIVMISHGGDGECSNDADNGGGDVGIESDNANDGGSDDYGECDGDGGGDRLKNTD